MIRHPMLRLVLVSFGAITPVAGFAAVPSAGLVARYDFSGDARDSAGGHDGIVHGARSTPDRFGRDRGAFLFDGLSDYIEIPDTDVCSLTTTGALSISVWMRPDVLTFPKTHNGYVHWLGKGETGEHEWTFRIYSAGETPDRENRCSFYLFNRAGLEGAGTYVQEPMTAGVWCHFVAVADMAGDTITWYKNGRLVDRKPFQQSPYQIVPENASAPVRIGTRDFASYFKGAIDDLRIYDRPLSATEIEALFTDDSISYEAWSVAHDLTGAASDPTGDPDGDGLCNLIEYAFAGDPGLDDRSSIGLSIGIGILEGAETILLRHRLDRRVQATITVSASADLVRWNPIPSGHIVLDPDIGRDGIVSLVAETVPLATDRFRFYRLVITP